MVELRPYQAAGINFLADRGRACLFDEPGLGKTMQALLAMRDIVPNGRILVVGTGDSIGVWKDEITFWLEEDYEVVHGLRADAASFDRAQGFVITNYSRLATALSRHWDGIIFDESQALRNRNTRTLYKAVKDRLGAAKYGMSRIPVFFLSGTPIVKAAGDIWPMLHTINKSAYNSYWRFVKTYANAWHDEFGWHVEGVRNVSKMWAALEEVALRRLVSEAQPDLPPLQRQRIPLQMTPKQWKVYRQLEQDLVADLPGGGLILTPSVLALETRLRQLLVYPPLVGVDDPGAGVLALREVAAEHRRPFVVFIPFAEALKGIEGELLGFDRPIYRVRGGMGDKLQESVNLFKMAAKAGEAPILLSSVQMAKSWSVSRVTHECYMLGFDWNETTMKQAESRLRRDGQASTSFSRYFVHEDSHDMEALAVLGGKRRLADVILDRKIVRRFRAGNKTVALPLGQD